MLKILWRHALKATIRKKKRACGYFQIRTVANAAAVAECPDGKLWRSLLPRGPATSEAVPNVSKTEVTRSKLVARGR
ncbi:MAG: hypothetical protein ACR2NF_07325, partial [Pirellulales bacterium]